MARKTNYKFEKLQRERRKADKKAEKAKKKIAADADSELSKSDLPADRRD